MREVGRTTVQPSSSDSSGAMRSKVEAGSEREGSVEWAMDWVEEAAGEWKVGDASSRHQQGLAWPMLRNRGSEASVDFVEISGWGVVIMGLGRGGT